MNKKGKKARNYIKYVKPKINKKTIKINFFTSAGLFNSRMLDMSDTSNDRVLLAQSNIICVCG